MSIQIEKISEARPHEWDAIWQACDHAAYTQSRAWAELWQAYAPGAFSPAPRLVTFSDGRQALLPLSFAKYGRGVVTGLESSPGGTYGGWIASAPLEPEHARLLTDHLLSLDDLVWMENPYDPLARASLGATGAAETTWNIDLRAGRDDILRRMNKHRIPQMMRSAERRGLTWGPLRDEDLDEAVRVYADCAARWAEPTVYTPEMFRLLRAQPGCDMFGAYQQDGQLIMAAVLLRGPKIVSYWLAFARTAALPLHPYKFLNYHLVLHYADAGFHWFDFLPSGPSAGADTFKRQFGANEVPLRMVVRRSLVHQLAEGAHDLRLSLDRRRKSLRQKSEAA